MEKIAIHSVPRSGSSWLGEIINSSPNVNYNFQPLFSYAFKSRLDDESSSLDIENFYHEISQTDDEFIRQIDDRKSGKKPVFYKDSKITAVAYKEVRYHYVLENLLEKCPEIKVIGLVRNPYSVINSWFNAPREFRKDLGWKLESELLAADEKNQGRKEEYFGLNKWIETTLLFERLQKKYPENFYLLEYEDLCSNTIDVVKALFIFLGLEYTEQTASFLSEKKEVKGTYSVMKNKNQAQVTKVELSESIIEAINRVLTKNKLTQYAK
jgi:hypothetical protein